MSIIKDTLALPSHRHITFKIYIVTTSLAVGVMGILFGRINRLLSPQQSIQQWLLLLILANSSIPMVILYCKSRSEDTRNSLQLRARLTFTQLLVPTLLKVILTYTMFSFRKFTNSPCKIPVVAICLIGLELFQYYKSRNTHSRIKISYGRLGGILALILSDVIGSYETGLCDDWVEFIGKSIVLGVCGVGIWVLNRKLFDMYKCEVEEMLAKSYVLEVLINFVIILSGAISKCQTSLQCMGKLFVNLPLSRGGFLNLELVLLFLTLFLVKPVFEVLIFNGIKQLDASQTFFAVNSGVFWLRIELIFNKEFSALAFLSLFCILSSFVYFFKLLKYRQLVGFVQFLFGKCSRGGDFTRPHLENSHSISLQQYHQRKPGL